MKQQTLEGILWGSTLPESVAVAGIECAVVPNTELKEHGTFNYEQLEFDIFDDSGRPAWRTLWHEMTHAGFAFTGLGEMLDDGVEEAVVSMLDDIVFPAVLATIIDALCTRVTSLREEDSSV